jgi:hypothetical protein
MWLRTLLNSTYFCYVGDFSSTLVGELFWVAMFEGICWL